MFRTDLHTVAIIERDDCFRLASELIWHDGHVMIVVPVGQETDFASIPRALRAILKQNGRSRRAAVLHDYGYRTGGYPTLGWTRAQTDELFYRAMLADGMPRWKAWPYYAGVKIGGWVVWRKRTAERPASA